MSDDNDEFSLASLGDGEVSLLAKLTRLAVRTDGELSAAERERIDLIASKVGESFWQFMDEASRSEDNVASVLEQAASIENRDAQELIYGTLYELSITDGTDGEENALLDGLAAAWKLEISDVGED